MISDDIWWPDDLARHDAACERAIAEDEGRTPTSPPVPLEIGSGDIDAVKRAISVAEEACAVTEGIFAAADTIDADMPTLNRAQAAYDAAIDLLSELEKLLDELESASWYDELRERRGDYWWAVI